MSTYTLPREAYDLLVEALGEKSKAETLAHALERSIQAVEERADQAIVERKTHIKYRTERRTPAGTGDARIV